jgi:hypothetical protein
VNTAKKHRHEAIWWSIELPEGWSLRDDPECATLTSTSLKGVLQLSASRKDSDIHDGELFELADEQPEPESVEIGLFTGLCNTHDAEGLRWKKWWLARDRTLIFATYNGPLHSADAEIQAAEGLLKTLEVRRS